MLEVVRKISKPFVLFCVIFLAFAGVNGATHAKQVIYQADVVPSLQVTIPTDLIKVILNPTTKPFDTIDFAITVATNNPTGYALSVESDFTALVMTENTSVSIPTLQGIEGGYTEENFEANRWGYKINGSNFLPFIPGQTIDGVDHQTNGHTTNMTFASKVNFDLPGGIYENEIDFVAVVNPMPVGYMQDSKYCPSDPTFVVDERDGEEYIIQKLADGNCWMLDNLRLDPTAVSLDNLKGNTNASDAELTNLKNNISASWTGSGQNSYVDPYINTDSKNVIAANKVGTGSGKIGVYYNYCAASAGSYCYAYSEEGSKDAISDICPAGWRMPTGGEMGSNSEYDVLYSSYSYDATSFKAALSTPLSGWFDNGFADGQDEYGIFWSSSYKEVGDMKTLDVQTSNVNLDYDYGRYYGASVRCVMKGADIRSVEYLQQLTPGLVNNTEIGVTATLKDVRDDETYLVGKLADDNVWMLDNLRLDPVTTSIESLLDNTNASVDSLTYLKYGGGVGQYPANAVSSAWADDRSSPFINADYKYTVSSVTYGNGSGKIGVYYNACAASAGSYCYSSGWPAKATEDLCPAGWRLPTGTGGDESEFKALYETYNSDLATFYGDFGVVLSGNLRNGGGTTPSQTQEGAYGRFWSSNGTGYGALYDAYVTSSSFSVASQSDGYWGESIRCIFSK